MKTIIFEGRSMENRYRKLMGLVLLLGTLVLAACGKQTEPVSVMEINFNQDTYPDFVAEVKGLDQKEDWGRWSNADVSPTVIIKFKNPLPKNFTLTLTAQVNQQNESPRVRIGAYEQELFIQKTGETVSIPVDLEESADTIEIIPANPIAPKKLGVNSDTRKLGVGLYSLKIEN
jgi:phosphoglycerol transferase